MLLDDRSPLCFVFLSRPHRKQKERNVYNLFFLVLFFSVFGKEKEALIAGQVGGHVRMYAAIIIVL